MLWSALVAINGFGFAANQASALELGELTVQSALGQPLRASISYALAPNETIDSHCIFLRPAASTAGLPTTRDAAASASNGMIRLTGNRPIREPILYLNLMVDCPRAANLSRQYTVLLDPSTGVPKPVATTTADRAPATIRRAEPATTTRDPARSAASNPAPIGSIGNNSTYRVQRGDTLSGIAARIEDRDIGLWQAVDVIFAANPDAFIDNDRNRMRAGSLLLLPDMGTVSAPVPARASTSPAAAPSRSTAPDTATGPAQATASARPDAPVRETANPAATSSRATATAVGSTAISRPGDATTGPDGSFVSTIEPRDGATSGTFGPARDMIPDTPVDAATARPTPRVSTAADDGSEGVSSLAWLGGTGLAIILGLLLFGRRLKARFGSPGDVLPPGITRGRRGTDAVDEPEPATISTDNEATDTFESPIRARPAALDADLGTGSGFDDDGEIDVAQDFGFSTSHDLYEELDMELTETAESPKETAAGSVPPERFDARRFTDTVIVEKEIPPSDDTGEYDLSMIVDATRQPMANVEDTTKDLHAVRVDTEDNETLNDENITLSREVDYKILEQDYEEELTATQALNAELMKEAKLAARAKTKDAAMTAEAPTVEYAAVDEDLTMQLPGDDLEPTAEMPLDQEPDARAPETLEDSGVNAEVTTELPAADNDETLAMDIESATIDTKKLRAS